MYTIINKIYLNELGNQIFFDITSASPSNRVIHSIVLEKYEDVVYTLGIPTPSETPFATITTADIIDYDATQINFNTSFNIDPVEKNLLFVFIYYALTSTPTIIVPVNVDIVCIHNAYDYLKAYNKLTKKITQNNSVPKDLLDLILLNKTVYYAIASSNYEKAFTYFTSLINYYD